MFFHPGLLVAQEKRVLDFNSNRFSMEESEDLKKQNEKEANGNEKEAPPGTALESQEKQAPSGIAVEKQETGGPPFEPQEKQARMAPPRKGELSEIENILSGRFPEDINRELNQFGYNFFSGGAFLMNSLMPTM